MFSYFYHKYVGVLAVRIRNCWRASHAGWTSFFSLLLISLAAFRVILFCKGHGKLSRCRRRKTVLEEEDRVIHFFHLQPEDFHTHPPQLHLLHWASLLFKLSTFTYSFTSGPPSILIQMLTDGEHALEKRGFLSEFTGGLTLLALWLKVPHFWAYSKVCACKENTSTQTTDQGVLPHFLAATVHSCLIHRLPCRSPEQ